MPYAGLTLSFPTAARTGCVHTPPGFPETRYASKAIANGRGKRGMGHEITAEKGNAP